MEDNQLMATLVPQSESELFQDELNSRQAMHKNDLLNFTIVKRNGTLVPFRKDRVFNALESAFRDTKNIPRPLELPAEILQIITKVTDLIVEEAIKMASLGALLTVEGIQDIVEVKLMETGHHDVAKDYILYRDEHKKLRKDSPRALKIIRRDGVSFVRFNPMKIASAIERGFRDTMKVRGPTPASIIESVNHLTNLIVDFAMKKTANNQILSIEMIQDEIEKQLMIHGYYEVAKDFILYRAEQAKEREKQKEEENLPFYEEELEVEEELYFTVQNRDGSTSRIGKGQLRKKIAFATQGYESVVNIDSLVEQSIANFYEGIKDHEVDLANIMAARAKIEFEPAYTFIASRLLLDVLYRETMTIEAAHPNLKKIHKKYFKEYFRLAVSLERLDSSLLGFDLDKLADAIDLSRDLQFTYLGLQTLYDRYFIHHEGKKLETPQIFWMRVAMGLAIGEKKQKEKRAIEFYNVLSKFLYICSTPTLFNSGTPHSQLSSCYLSTVMDDLAHIYKVIADDAMLSKWAGGLGNDWTNVRATGSIIKGTNGKSQGVIPFLKVANDTAVAVNQCFAPETLIYTGDGIKPISQVEVGDLVLGIKGIYREVTEKFTYNQTDGMVSLTLQHSCDPVLVTSGHPFYAIRQAELKSGKMKCEWIEAGALKSGDYIAQVIPKEIVSANLNEEDARLYGILLSNGHMAKNGMEWTISNSYHLEFVRSYLSKQGIHFCETNQGVHWLVSNEAICEGTTGETAGLSSTPLFSYEDVYNKEGQKHIAPRFAHLPHSQTSALIQGLVGANEKDFCKKEVSFTHPSRVLIEDMRYQLLRLEISARSNRDNASYGLQIPAVENRGLVFEDHIFTCIEEIEEIEPKSFVCDLKVEGAESYMTTAGLAHNGGKRKGAMCAYLETWHLDIEDFLELRKNTGDERRRTHDMNTANWIPDLFMKRVLENGQWTLFSPEEVPDLHHLYGKAFEKRYLEYEDKAKKGEIHLFKRVEALILWRKMLSMLYETGHPWITFKDPSNIRSPQNHVGVVHSSNLCTEILLNTSAEETAVCNLGSINLYAHLTDSGIDRKLFSETIRTAIRMLDNVININFYPTEEAKHANLRHRPIGLGLMGFQDALYKLGISYASHEAVEFADESMELISYYAILSSSELAKERGAYSSYKGSKWDLGIFPIDSIALLAKERGETLVEVDTRCRLDWTPVRESVKKYGMRNSNTMAIAPTATIANITGVTQSIEPMYKHLFVKSNLSGEFTILNAHLIEELKKINLWDEEMLDDLKYFDGSLLEIERVPENIKRLFLTAFEIDPDWLIECASRRQKWIDMGQSLNLYLSEPSGKKLNQMYFMAWKKGLKTTYYLRALGATHIEKSTTDINKRGLQPRWMKSKSASSRIIVEREKPQKPFVCNLDEGCESCQ